MISPGRSWWYSPGWSDVIAPTVTPSHSGPPWCGQRLRIARYSPPTLKTPIERPATSTMRRVPGGRSAVSPTTTLGTGRGDGEVVERGGVVVQDAAPHALRQARRQGSIGRVEVPVRVVG